MSVTQTSTSNRLFKRALAYVFLISVVCVFSSGLSILSSAVFQWIGKTRRSRASKHLPVAKYEKNLQRSLLQHLLEADFVLDRIPMAEIDKLHTSSTIPTENSKPSENDVSMTISRVDRSQSADSSSGDSESCSICLDDFENGEDIKVCAAEDKLNGDKASADQLPCLECRSFHANTSTTLIASIHGLNVAVAGAHCASAMPSPRVRCQFYCSLPMRLSDVDLIFCPCDTVNGPSKKLFGIPLPHIDQILQQEQVGLVWTSTTNITMIFSDFAINAVGSRVLTHATCELHQLLASKCRRLDDLNYVAVSSQRKYVYCEPPSKVARRPRVH